MGTLGPREVIDGLPRVTEIDAPLLHATDIRS